MPTRSRPHTVTAKLKGNAAGNVLKSLLKKDLIKEVRAKRDDTVWRHDEERGRMTLVATKAAFAALGIDVRDAAEDAEAETAAPVPAKVEAKPDARPKTPKSKEPKEPRKHSKQAQLIAMLRRIKGATIDEIAEVLEWQPHTVRGAIAGALKKKLGLTIVSEKSELSPPRLSHIGLMTTRVPSCLPVTGTRESSFCLPPPGAQRLSLGIAKKLILASAPRFPVSPFSGDRLPDIGL